MAQQKNKPYVTQENPVYEFISEPQENQPEKPAVSSGAVPDGYKRNPEFLEKKTRRLQLVLQPSLYEKIKLRADQNGTSVNDYIHKILEDNVKE